MPGETLIQEKFLTDLLLATDFAFFFLLLWLLMAVIADPYLKKRHRKLLLIVSLLVGTLVAQEQLDTYLGFYKISRIGRTLVAIYGYQMKPVILAIFVLITDMVQKHKWIWIPVIANAVIYLTALFSGVAFRFQEDFTFVRGPLGYSCHVISFALLLYLMGVSIHRFGSRRRFETAVPIAILCMMIVAILADLKLSSMQWVSFTTSGMVCSCFFYYVWLHLQFAMEHERALMAEQQIQVTISQIQPHFLYSTLSLIQMLCKRDPNRAYEVVKGYDEYLRENQGNLRRMEMIPFQKELEHTQKYLDIVRCCYPDLRIELDVREEDFQVPGMTLQPIVECAFCHDDIMKEQGLIRVSTSREGDHYEVVVWDNGTGFPEKTEQNMETYQIGLENVRQRVEIMCDGTLEVEGFPNEGTIVTMRIPVEEQ